MRPSIFVAAIPFVLGCAQQSASRAPTLPSDEPLQVRLHRPTGGSLYYALSEPGYVAIFAVTRGSGIRLLYPHFLNETDDRSHAGLNLRTVQSGRAYSYTFGSRNEYRTLVGPADAYYVIASKYPLPIEDLIRSPSLLGSLAGADLFRANSFTDTWAALEDMLVEGLPDDAWASDVYMNWRAPLSVTSWPAPHWLEGCASQGIFGSAISGGQCGVWRTVTPVAPIPIAKRPPVKPPAKPLYRDPSVPPPPEHGVARSSRSGNAASSRARTRTEPARATGRASTAARPRSGTAPARAAGTRPSQAPGSKAQPKPAN